jgi:ribonuclease HII
VNERFAFDLEAAPAAAGGAGEAGRRAVGGADEAGRGCLAGPLVAAAVCFDYAAFTDADFAALDGLNDSKRLTKARRAALYAEVLRRARQVTVACCSPATIDREGLHRCNLATLACAAERLAPAPAVLLVDGFALRGCTVPHRPVVGGDGRSAAIAAASIVAKVTRDRLMLALHERHPCYGFDHHVGYATAEHHAAIAEHGVCELHRLSFASVAYQQLGLEVGPGR